LVVIRAHFAVLVLSLALLAGCQSNAGKKGLVGTFKIGERAQVGPLIYNVYETQYMVTIGEGAEARVPKNRFLIVHLTVVNGGGATADQSIPTFTLLDDAGESYNEMDNGAGVPQWLGFARKVRPAESTTGNIVFDVAPKHYRLRVADELDEHYALVDLPLTFDTGAPPPPPSNPGSVLPKQ
jgi:hypothetical protein